MKKKVLVVQVTTPEAAGELAGLPLEATVAMADVAAAMREGLLAFATSAGLVVMQGAGAEEIAPGPEEDAFAVWLGPQGAGAQWTVRFWGVQP